MLRSNGFWPWGTDEQDERNQLERDGSQSHNIRRVASYGALAVVLGMYGFGVFVIALFLGLVPCFPAVGADKWHIVVTVLAALFTVPTVLLLAVMRSTTATRRDEGLPQSTHEALGQAVSKIFDKIVDSIK